MLKTAAVFSDHMVLQCESLFPFGGRQSPEKR
jgi:hypothetical protein